MMSLVVLKMLQVLAWEISQGIRSGSQKHDELVSHCEGREDVRYSLSNKLGDDVMNQGGVGGIR